MADDVAERIRLSDALEIAITLATLVVGAWARDQG